MQTRSLVTRCPYSKLPWEIIIVDDASPDGTLEVAQQLQRVYGEDHIVSTRPLHPTRRTRFADLARARFSNHDQESLD